MTTSTTSRGNAEGGAAYYYVKGSRVPLERDPSVYAVRFKPAVREDSPALSPSSRRLLREESEPVAFIANYGLRVLRATQPRSVTEQLVPIDRLDAEEGVDQAVLAFRRTPGGSELMFTTRRFVVQFRPDVDADRIGALNARYGVRIAGPAAYMSNGFVLEAPNGEGPAGPVVLANVYFESGLALSATPDFVREVHTKHATATRLSSPPPATAPAPPRTPLASTARTDGEYLDQQWHLTTAKVVPAWNVTTGDPSIVVAVLDDGVDVDHAEFAGKVVGQSDFATHVSDARPKSPNDKHGTACAGVAVAAGVKAYGAAPGASLLAVRTPEFLGVADEAEMFRWVCDEGADVISCSWGPADGTGATDLLPDNVRAAIRYCITDGRGGKGIPIVWAAGNGNESVSLDGYAANPDVMAIGASTNKEVRSWYSDFGPEVWICAPSSGSSANGDRRVFTTDRTGATGYNPGNQAAGDAAGDYTNDFGGTSSATPLVAGIIALMLSANPDLTHQEVRNILRSTASRIGDASSYDSTGHSPLYGFGRVDAEQAVNAAAGGGTPSVPEPAGRPWISGPTTIGRSDPAPTFSVGTGNNPLYAVEVATRWQLFDGSHDSERTADSFYGTWQGGPMLSSPTFALPADVWDLLRAADRLYYRVHSARDDDWNDWQVSTPDDEASNAPSVEITAGAMPSDEQPRSTSPSVSGPASADRGGPAPVFSVDTAAKPFYAFEIAAQSTLFDSSQESGRTGASYWASWLDQGMLTGPSFSLPAIRWSQLQTAGRLYYRVHVADDDQWTGWAVSTPDEQADSAPFLSIRSTGGSSAPNGSARTVTYPSTTFTEALDPDDDLDYSDPVSGGSVPLIEVRDRLDERLSTNFSVRELAARRVTARTEFAAYARISPDLVRGLQGMRDALGKAISVNSCYRYPALNDDVDGAGQSQHMAGRAADVRSTGVEPLELARLALQVFGGDIGLGLGRTIVHVDVRGESASWVYDGAALSEADFDAWVRKTAADLGRSPTSRQDLAERTRPSITGPTAAPAGSTPPTFAVFPGRFPYIGVELASDWVAFSDSPGVTHSDLTAFFASWRDDGLQPSGAGESTTFQVPEREWDRLAGSGRLYYRALGGWTKDAAEAVLSVPVERAEEAPSIQVSHGRGPRSDRPDTLLDPATTRRNDESRWRAEPAPSRT